jgi:hypothetical protein
MPNRTLCDVLEEMRKSYETRNFSYLPGLLEEAQSLGNRMESALWDQKDIKRLKEKKKELKEEIEELKEERKELKKGKDAD